MASTMKDLSRETGLGLATISKYFNGGTVREKNRVLKNIFLYRYLSYKNIWIIILKLSMLTIKI